MVAVNAIRSDGPIRALLKNQCADSLCHSLASLGVTLRQARQLHAAVLRSDAFPDALSSFKGRLLAEVRAATALPRLGIMAKEESARDGFTKYLFRGNGEQPFEAVRIPLTRNPQAPTYVVCVSSQVGCALGCAFCATGRMGFQRDLAPWEIVDQVLQIRRDSAHPIRGVVFMGMGEPLLNYDAVMMAARIMSEPCGLAIAGKAITISTAGIIPGIHRLTNEGVPYRLVFSLTSADPEKRRSLMPVEAAYPSADVMSALRDYHAKTGRRVTLAWTMLSGVNTGEADAKSIAALVRGLPIKIDLIDVNDPTGRFTPPSADELGAFRDFLRTHVAAPVDRRYSGGRDINAACGMLAGSAQA